MRDFGVPCEVNDAKAAEAFDKNRERLRAERLAREAGEGRTEKG